MFAFLKAKRREIPKLLGWSKSKKLPQIRDPESSFTKHRARECKVIARQWDALASQADTAEQRLLRKQIADGWRDLAGGR